jgi:hypothetical protein
VFKRSGWRGLVPGQQPDNEGGYHVKLRSRFAAVAAAAGLLAGVAALGGTPSHAQDTILIDCDRVAGTVSVKPALSNVAVANTAVAIKGPNVAGTDPFKPAVTTRDCTGILATTDSTGTPDNVGNLTKVAGKLVGSATCNLVADPPITDPLDPLDGKITLTFTTLDPSGKAWASSEYVRIGGGSDPLKPDELVVSSGIVTKGAGVGADVYGGFIFSPYDSKTKPITPDQSFIDSNSELQPGSGSTTIGANCIAGLTTLGTAFFGTDGTGLLGGVEDSSLGISLPAPA